MYCAGIVTYNPLIDQLRKNINAISYQVKEVIIVDNGSKNIKEIEFLVSQCNNIKIIALDKNMGIAYALNEIMKYAKNKGFFWCLTLDQDSIVPNNIIKEMEKAIKEDVAIICPLINYHNGEDLKIETKFENIDRCITSASLTSIKAWEDVNGFDEIMFIDYVDFDFCKRVQKKDSKVVQCCSIVLDHSLGNIKRKKFFGREIAVYNHNDIRTFYFSRNFVYYIRKNCTFFEGITEIKNNYKWFLLKIFFEDNRVKKLKIIIKGFYKGFLLKVK